MFDSRFLAMVATAVLVATLSAHTSAGGGTTVVATKGQPAFVSAGWPEGAAAMVNDAARTSGWNAWFSEWPNDVNQYAYEVPSTVELNRLIAQLAKVKAELRQIRLSPRKEPGALGWVTHLPEGNRIPVLFSIGDQSRIEEWYGRVRKPFGVMEFVEAPQAVPPTLTIYVQNESVKLDELVIPEGLDVILGEVPTLFHKLNTKAEREQEKLAREGRAKPEVKAPESLDEATLSAMKAIEAFLVKREAETKR